MERYSGPIPHPRHLREYDRVLPGSADRILKMAELEEFHRHALEDSTAATSKRLGQWGMICGLVVALGGLALATVLGLHGDVVVGSVLGGGDLVALVTVFVIGNRSRGRP